MKCMGLVQGEPSDVALPRSSSHGRPWDLSLHPSGESQSLSRPEAFSSQGCVYLNVLTPHTVDGVLGSDVLPWRLAGNQLGDRGVFVVGCTHGFGQAGVEGWGCAHCWCTTGSHLQWPEGTLDPLMPQDPDASLEPAWHPSCWASPSMWPQQFGKNSHGQLCLSQSKPRALAGSPKHFV